MATRSLTEVFILMRNNAMQNRHLFSDQVSDDRQALVAKCSDIELGDHARLPPEWVDGLEEVQYEISRIKQKMKDLASLHDKHLNRPTLDDSVDEEHAIEIQTQEVTQMFWRCQRLLQQIGSRTRSGSTQEQRLSQNVVSSVARTIQELSTNFRRSQSTYLKKLNSREERSQQYFETVDLNAEAGYTDEMNEIYDRGFTSSQMVLLEENSMFVEQRDREVSQIVKSIQDLNEMFKDLAQLIVDQGTILDRIDYNVEQTATTVEKGLQQLQKAEKYQKKNRKMLVIIVLAVIVIVLVLILIGVKMR